MTTENIFNNTPKVPEYTLKIKNNFVIIIASQWTVKRHNIITSLGLRPIIIKSVVPPLWPLLLTQRLAEGMVQMLYHVYKNHGWILWINHDIWVIAKEYIGRVMEVRLSFYLVLLSVDSKTW